MSIDDISEVNKGGRPSKYQDIDLNKVSALALKGWTDAEMADFFEVHRATWYRWKHEYQEFCDTLKEWKKEADSVVERSLFERATGYNHPEDKIFNNNGEPMVVSTLKHYAPDTTAGIFWLKNRQPEVWRDRVESHNTHSIDLSNLSDDELYAITGTKIT